MLAQCYAKKAPGRPITQLGCSDENKKKKKRDAKHADGTIEHWKDLNPKRGGGEGKEKEEKGPRKLKVWKKRRLFRENTSWNNRRIRGWPKKKKGD